MLQVKVEWINYAPRFFQNFQMSFTISNGLLKEGERRLRCHYLCNWKLASYKRWINVGSDDPSPATNHFQWFIERSEKRKKKIPRSFSISHGCGMSPILLFCSLFSFLYTYIHIYMYIYICVYINIHGWRTWGRCCSQIGPGRFQVCEFHSSLIV